MRKNYKKIITLTLVAALLSTGCGAFKEGSKEIKTIATKETNADEVKKEEGLKREENTNTQEYMTADGFHPVFDLAEDYDFVMEQVNEVEKKFIGEYELNLGTVDKIEVGSNSKNQEIYIDINGNRKVIESVADLTDVKVIDLDRKDSSKELVIYDAGPSDDPCLIFFKVTDGEAKELGYACGMTNFHDVLVDGDGKIIDGYGYIDFLEVAFVDEYNLLVGDSFVKNKEDFSGALGKKYTCIERRMVGFLETDTADLNEDYYGIEDTIELMSGDELTLLDANVGKGLYFVELADGRKGVIRLQMAG